MWSSVKKKKKLSVKEICSTIFIQIFYMPGVLVNEIWYGISQCMRFIPFNYDINKILANASYAMPIDKNNNTQWHVL